MKDMSFNFDAKSIYEGNQKVVFMSYTTNGYPGPNRIRFEVERKDFRAENAIPVLKIRIPSTESSDGEDIQFIGKPEAGVAVVLPLRHDTFSGETTFLFWGGCFYEPRYETIRPQAIGLEEGIGEIWTIEKLIGFEERNMTPYIFGLMLNMLPGAPPPGIQTEEIVKRFLQR